ncbi:tetraacyldisaccharide 4'-kinase [Candidatus Pelagibacter communis]|uniref:tetraacyldisaccharide 4'-kinase n=1 Tax=Pelagibacter ubique TaxID=198252 RepID=UPI00094CB3D5|nr:tetraacyldisaccharide 4'-kinase [Candidatus Pelagibacter ubique]
MNLKKPRFWEIKKPNFLAYLLLPIAVLIQFLSLLKSSPKKTKFKIKTICIGNIYIGGTGKTSLSIEVKNILEKKSIKSCFIKKYYSNQKDEQILLKNHGELFLSKKRFNAITEAEKKGFEVAILDDGLQDKSVEYDTKIVCFNNINWIGNGFTIPAGPLREKISNLKNYENVFINGNLQNLEQLKKEILNINPNIQIYIGKYMPENLDEFNIEDNYLAFSGIGNHGTFISMMEECGFKILKDLEFADHYDYKDEDIKKIINLAKELDCKIVTTEKDFLRLKDMNFNNLKFIKSKLNILEKEKFIESII